MINIELSDSIFVAFERRCDLSFLDIDDFDLSVGAADGKALGRFVKRKTVSDGIACIYIH